MANPHIKTYQFRDKQLGNGDEIRLTIAITINAEGTTETIISEDENVFITDIGRKEEDYDFEDTLLSPAFYSAVLSAIENGSFQKYFFDEGEAVFEDAEKTALVTVDIKYSGTTTWVNDFTGNVIIDSLEYNPDSTRFDFEAAPDMSILSNTMLFDLEDNPINPFGYEMSDPPQPGAFYQPIKTILLDAYKLINPSLTESDILIEHDWNFYGEWFDEEQNPYNVTDITLDEVEVDIYSLFFDQTYGITSVADVLIRLAQEFGCFTGMLSRDKVFFKKLFDTASAYEYNLDDEAYFDYRKKYKFNPVTYVKVTVRESVWIFSTPGYVDYNFYVAEAGTFTGLKDSFKEIDTLTIAAIWANSYRATNLRATRNLDPFGDVAYDLIAAADPNFHYPGTSTVWFNFGGLPDYVPTNQLLADFWYLYKSTNRHLRVDPIVAPGLDHSLVKNPRFLNKLFQPVRIKKRYKDCQTDIDGLIISTD